MKTRLAFGQFIEFWRRDKGWNVERLAMESDISTEEILDIEHNSQHSPDLDTVIKLASTLRLSSRRMMELAGLIEMSSPSLKIEAIHFMAHSEPVEDLKENEREALKTFTKSLVDEPLSV